MPPKRDNDEERSTRIDRLVEQPRTQNANSEMRRGLRPRDGDVMLTGASPANGDIVVDSYAPQEGRCQHVRTWLTDNWVDFVLLEDFRTALSFLPQSEIL